MAFTPYTGGGRRARRAPMAEINVTPMVDVMLVLLIIFMVTAPLLVAGVKVELPDSFLSALDQQHKPVQISIDKDGTIFVDNDKVAPDALSARLAQVAAASQEPGGPRIFLRADRGLDYGRVMAVMGESDNAGLRKAALVSGAGQEPR